MSNIYRRPTTTLSCTYCSSIFEKENREITRSENRGALHYCSRTCSSKDASEKRWGDTAPIKSFIRACKKRSKDKGLDFNLTEPYLVKLYRKQNGMCAITGMAMQLLVVGRGGKVIDQASLDRIDNSKGYIEGNVQFTLLGINYMRNTFEVEDVLDLIKRLKEE